MPRRALTFATSAVLVLGLVLGGALLPVPYVALFPGPTKNVLGKADGKPLIRIGGRETHPPGGHLNLVTVAYRGGPGTSLDLISALRGWVDPQVAVLPEEALFPESRTPEEVRRSTSRQMSQSQENATVAALRELDVPVQSTVSVARVIKGLPAEGRLQQGDVLVAVDREKISGPREVSDLVGSHQPGEKVTFTINRDGERRQVTVTTTAAPSDSSKAMVGVYMGTEYDYPLDVSIRIDEIGGPSAGMIFALGIIDKLTEGNLTSGNFVAGTGTITPSGDVGPIGGIEQKMAGAHADGATVFLTPAKNCAAASRAKPQGLRLVKVDTLGDARQALRALETGQGKVPRCASGGSS